MTEDKNVDEGMGRAWWASALVVLVVVVGLVAVLVTRDDRPAKDTTASSTPGPSSAPSGSTTAADPSASTNVSSSSTTTADTVPTSAAWPEAGCNGTPGSGAPAQAGLLAVSWEPVGAVSLPSSKVLGPTKVNGPVRSCFNHSPGGAVMAAANITGSLGSTTYRQVLTAQMTAGPGRDQTISKAAQDAVTDTGERGQLNGYKIGACTPAACNVSLAIQGRGIWVQQDVSLVWHNGDWYLNGQVPLASGGLLPNGLPPGWVAWSA